MKYHRLGGLNSRNLFSPGSRARSLTPGCWLGCFLLGRSVKNLFQPLVILALGGPWLAAVSLRVSSLSSLGLLCASVFNISSSSKDTRHWT